MREFAVLGDALVDEVTQFGQAIWRVSSPIGKDLCGEIASQFVVAKYSSGIKESEHYFDVVARHSTRLIWGAYRMVQTNAFVPNDFPAQQNLFARIFPMLDAAGR